MATASDRTNIQFQPFTFLDTQYTLFLIFIYVQVKKKKQCSHKTPYQLTKFIDNYDLSQKEFIFQITNLNVKK